MNLRKPACIILAVLLLCALSVNAYAAPFGGTGGIVTPQWANTSHIISGLSFSGTTAICSVSIDGYAGTTKISATYELQKKSGTTYTTIKTWTASANDEYLDWNSTYSSITTGTTYRLYVTAKVTRNGTIETANGWTEGKA